MSKFDKITGQVRENLLMETAMLIENTFCYMLMNGEIDRDKVEEYGTLERYTEFKSMTREYEDIFYDTDEYNDNWLGHCEEWARPRIKDLFG